MQISSTGSLSAVGDVMCETSTGRVRTPMLAISSSGSQRTRFARMNSSVRTIAPYSCFVVRISSSGRIRSERMTEFRPDVALGTNTRSSGLAPTNAASDAPASSSKPGSVPLSGNHPLSRLVRKSVGSRSSSRWKRWYSSKTARGQAP